MLKSDDIRKKLNLSESDDWNNRHFLPSTKSGFVISDKYLERKSVIRDMGEMIAVKTNIRVNISKNNPFYYKRYWDNVLDWECMNMISERNNYLINISSKMNMANIVKLLERYIETNIINPQDLDGYDNLTPEDRLFLRIILIYNKIPTKDEVIKDLMLIDGIGEHRAEAFFSKNIYLYEDLLKNSEYSIFTFRVNRNHVLEFKHLFDIIHETLYKKRSNIIMTIAGSLGRGESSGHDIDVLFNEKDKPEVLEIVQEMAYRTIGKHKNYNIILRDTFVRVDISFYKDIDKVTQFFHYFGPKDMNVHMRKKANLAGFSLNQYGLSTGKELIHPKNDAELFSLLKIEDPRPKYWKNFS